MIAGTKISCFSFKIVIFPMFNQFQRIVVVFKRQLSIFKGRQFFLPPLKNHRITFLVLLFFHVDVKNN